MHTAYSPQQITFRRRLPFVLVGLVAFSVVLFLRLISFQLPLDPAVETYLNNLRDAAYSRTLLLADARGNIYDRTGEALAVNRLEYRVGVSPSLIAERRTAAIQLAAILDLGEAEVYNRVNSTRVWELLAPNVSAAVASEVRALGFDGITLESVPRRSYPQGAVAAQVIGFVGGERGYYGVEGYYNSQLAGSVRERRISNIPFDIPYADLEQERGREIVLTIDRDVQFIVESELLNAIDRYGGTGGTIIVMQPRTGDILAMANYPAYDPNQYFDVTNERLLINPAISEQFEPGSIFKVLTMAAALETEAITPDWTYYDSGSFDIGGITIQNWDRRAWGSTDATQALVNSLNVGMATIATEMGPTSFYNMMDRFGIGRLTGVDLEGEQAGQMFVPGSENWSEAQLGTNSFGQGVAVTPLQMITAVSAIANGGLMMQPRIVHQVIDGDQVIPARTANLGRPISAETARIVTDMMVAVVNDGIDGAASIPGYTIAGKTGTAQIPTPIGYEQGTSIATFVGFLPADDPQLVVLIKIDRPADYWGAFVAAPTFRRLAERLVLMLEIPTDEVRLQLASQGGTVNYVGR